MKIKISTLLTIIFFIIQWSGGYAQKKYNSYKGLVMTGYQGWFNTPQDGANRGWYHYQNKNGFKPGSVSVDFWPDVKEYKQLYKTEFKLKDGSPAYTFSSYDFSTVNLHFKWMKDYGIDGAFMQRFVGEIKGEKGRNHFNKVLESATKSATEYGRAISVMYDLSGIKPGDEKVLLDDIDKIEETYALRKRKKVPTYLYHNGKPLVTVWGVGFNDGRAYDITEAENIVKGLKDRGYSVMLGVPTFWREMKSDTENDPRLHELIKKCDVIMPWFVARYNEKSYDNFIPLIQKDIQWVQENKIDYAPLCFPGFSWNNLKGKGSVYIDRNSGKFLWKQLSTSIANGAQMLYVAMFDEIDEGTAIFKSARRKDVPLNGDGKFEGIEDNLPSDHYLWLTGEAAKMLRKEREFSSTLPNR